MAIDVGEGLRRIQPITEMAKGTDYDFTKSADFRENFEKCLREHQNTGKEVLRKVKYSYDRLYSKHGVQPNAVMITPDYVAAVVAECFGEYRVVNMKPDQLLGMDVIVIDGKETVKACVIDKEE